MRKQALVSLAVTVFLHASLAGGVVAYSGWGGGGGEVEKEPERKVLTIEASLAYKSEEPSEQPQKERKRKSRKKAAKKAKKAPKIVPRDPNQRPRKDELEKPDDQEEEEDFASKFEELRNQRQADDEEDDSDFEESDTDVKPAGTFDGSKHGFAEVSRGDPYMRELAAGVYNGWELPESKQGDGGGVAIGCVRLDADGSVLAVDPWKKDPSNEDLNVSVELALNGIKKKRKTGAKPVPAHLMDATTQWICFKFSVDQ